MKAVILCLGLLGCRSLCHAAETVALKVPLTSFTEAGLAAEGVVKLDKPPAASPFFRKGDELYDLSGATGVLPKSGIEWVAWNASSGRLVMRGEWASIRRVERLLDTGALPIKFRFTIDVFESPVGIGAGFPQGKPANSRTIVLESARRFESPTDDSADPLRVSLDAYFSGQGASTMHPIAEGNISLSARMMDGGRLNISTAFAFDSEEPLWIARDSSAGTVTDVRFSAVAELPDGTPRRELLLIQKGKEAVPVALDRGQMSKRRVGDGWFMALAITPGGLDLIPGESPFEPATVKWKPGVMFMDHPKINPPAAISQLVDRPLPDMSDRFGKMGMSLQSGDFIVYDPFQELLFCYVREERTCHEVEIILSCISDPAPKMLAVHLDEGDPYRLIARSGHLVRMERLAEDGRTIGLLHLEPSVSEIDKIIDLRMEFRRQSGLTEKRSLATSVTLVDRVPQDLSESVSGGKSGPPLRVRVEIGDRHP